MNSNLKKIVEKAEDAFAHNKPGDFLLLCDEEIEWRMVGEKTLKGKSGALKWMEMGMANISYEPPKIKLTNVIEENQFVTAHGEMEIKKKNGEISKYSYCDIYRFRDDKIVGLTSFVIPAEL